MVIITVLHVVALIVVLAIVRVFPVQVLFKSVSFIDWLFVNIANFWSFMLSIGRSMSHHVSLFGLRLVFRMLNWNSLAWCILFLRGLSLRRIDIGWFKNGQFFVDVLSIMIKVRVTFLLTVDAVLLASFGSMHDKIIVGWFTCMGLCRVLIMEMAVLRLSMRHSFVEVRLHVHTSN